MIVYMATNTKNGKVYICRTIRPLKICIRGHKHKATIITSPFYNAIRKYGWYNFTWQIIDRCNTITEMYESKGRFIKSYKSTNREFGYNCTTGGLHRTYTEDTTKKISATVKELWKNPDIRENLMKNRKYLPASDETRKKRSVASKKMWKSPDFRAKMHEVHKNRPPASEETKKKMSDGLRRAYRRKRLLSPVEYNKDREKRKEQLRINREKYREKVLARTEKKCNKCHTVKKLDMFYKATANLDGHANICIECEKKRRKI